MILTRDEILDAVEYTVLARRPPPLLAAFRWRAEIVDFIYELADGQNWDWDNNEQGRQQRLLFLAFLLTWRDDLTDADLDSLYESPTADRYRRPTARINVRDEVKARILMKRYGRPEEAADVEEAAGMLE